MISVLADHNVEGQAVLIWGVLGAEGWLDLAPMSLVRLSEVGLPIDSSDRAIWRFAQANEMLLLTDNRNLEGADSLEQTIRVATTKSSLPVLTISRADRVIEPAYRERCAIRLLEIVLDIEDYLGAGRLYIP